MQLPPKHILTVDFETYYAQDFTLSKLTTEEYVRDPRFQTIGVGLLADGEAMWLEDAEFRAAIPSIPWGEVAVLCHNARFDAAILSWRYGVRPAMWLDTLSMARAIHSSVVVGGSLRKLAEYYELGEKGTEVLAALGKRREDFLIEEWCRYGGYCMQDCKLTRALYDRLMADGFPPAELRLIDVTIRMFAEPRIEGHQMMLAAAVEQEKVKKASLLERIGATREDVMSDGRLAGLFYQLGVTPPTKVSAAKTASARKADAQAPEVLTWAFAKSDAGFQALLEHPEDDVRFLAEARLGLKSTIDETRAERLLAVSRRGPIPMALNYCGAHTMRWSGAEKVNVQNFRRGAAGIRSALLAPGGHVVLTADSSQIEARVTAWAAEHAELLETFRSGRDVYCEFGTSVFGRTITKDDKRERHIAKTCVLGLGYGMGWLKLAMQFATGAERLTFGEADAEALDVRVEAFTRSDAKVERTQLLPARMTEDERILHGAVCEALVRRYRDVNAPIAELWTMLGNEVLPAMDQPSQVGAEVGPIVVERHALRMPNGLRLQYPGLKQDEDDGGYSYLRGYGKERTRLYGGSLTENIVQCLARIIIGEQMAAIADLGFSVVTCTHDEVVLVVPEVEAEATLQRVLAIMHTSPAWAPDLPLAAEGGYHAAYGRIVKRAMGVAP